MVRVEVVTHQRLPGELVHALQHLVADGVGGAGVEVQQLLRHAGVRLGAKDGGVEVVHRASEGFALNPVAVTHQPLRHRVERVEKGDL
ncbi:hypothetical protein DQ04_18341000 [Trypanosoma grayi]|uniref:hypothetical protein n=1 Tax=Trypanosoma grayi TaxID=71804 RepID=UPI0004F48182|nr:hypothetical protein DQ04_18341000 [Trypanosoma grayi]KEG05798.1 hypothetical protein DQ04_18341000 [Trypanosoma grayi]